MSRAIYDFGCVDVPIDDVLELEVWAPPIVYDRPRPMHAIPNCREGVAEQYLCQMRATVLAGNHVPCRHCFTENGVVYGAALLRWGEVVVAVHGRPDADLTD